jgi:diacylglycerol kinase family enzyme
MLKQALLRGRRALLQSFTGRLKFQLGKDVARKAEALSLLSPLISRAQTEETALEAAVLDIHSTGEVMRLGFRALVGEIGAGVGAQFGGWRDDPAVSIELVTSGRAWARGRIPAILDGEPTRLPRTVSFEFRPAAFRALAPPPAKA